MLGEEKRTIFKKNKLRTMFAGKKENAFKSTKYDAAYQRLAEEIAQLKQEVANLNSYIWQLQERIEIARGHHANGRIAQQIKRCLNACYIPFSYFKLAAKIVCKRPLGICAIYFNEERLKDGYYRRIRAVDNLLGDKFRVYFSFGERASRPWIEYPNKNTAVFYYNELQRSQCWKRNFLMFLTRKIYCHAIYQLEPDYLKRPYLKVYLDMHGCGPEEEVLYENYALAQKFSDAEALVVRKAERIFCVTEAMVDFLKEKYGESFKVPYTVMPIYDKKLPAFIAEVKNLPEDRYTVVYAGGCAKWQKIELMQDAIHQMGEKVRFKICVPKPDDFWDTWEFQDIPENLTVESKTYEQLSTEVYPTAQYGFVLRDDIAVNRVACPTKIAEYLEHDIIPILHSPNIGDFKKMGMVYLSLDDFLKEKFLSAEAFKQGVQKNRALLKAYKKVHENGSKEFKEIFKCAR